MPASRSSAAGYRAAIVAAEAFGRYFSMMITASGTATPAKVIVVGTGVAGLQAIATARRLGAVVTGYDVRAASRREVESLGAAFLTSSLAQDGDTGGYATALGPAEQATQQPTPARRPTYQPRYQEKTMSTMKAAVAHEFGAPLIVEQVPVPRPGPGQALVRLISTGVCHTDLHAIQGDWPVRPAPPFIPGHEGVGTVVEIGEGVTDLAPGQLVGNAWLWSACGTCEYCRTGWETLCEKQQNGGYSVDGSFAEYMLVDSRFAARIPHGVDPVEVAPVLCAGVTVYKGLMMTRARPGQWVVISGIGGLGHIAVQYARAMGLRVVAVDVTDDKLKLPLEHGAELTINAIDEDPVEVVQREIGGAQGVLVTAVHPSAFGQAIGMSRRGGTIVFNGLPPGDFPAPIFDIVVKGLTVRGSIVGTRQDLEESLDFYARGQIHPTVTRRSLGDINTVFDEMRRATIDGRVVISFPDTQDDAR